MPQRPHRDATPLPPRGAATPGHLSLVLAISLAGLGAAAVATHMLLVGRHRAEAGGVVTSIWASGLEALLLVGPATGLLFVLVRWLLQRHLRRAGAVAAHAMGVLFERSRDGLLICNLRGEVLSCNPLAAKLLGGDAELLVGSRISTFFDGASADSGEHFPIDAGEQLLRSRSAPQVRVQVDLHKTVIEGERRFIVAMCDRSEQQESRAQLQRLANYDSLTGLPNRAMFRDRLGQAMQRAQRSNQPMALMFLDLDRFKVVNDSLGHEVGDRLLCHVARVLAGALRETDTLAGPAGDDFTLSRLGGDEFTVITEMVGDADNAALIARRLLDALATPFMAGDEEIHISASIGVSLYPMDDVDLDGIIRHTDMAMYRSKSLGRNTFSFFSDDLNAAVSARLSLEGSLRHALERDEFCLHYQPKADLATGRVSGAEALIRWHCPGRGMVPPDRFIAVLEDTGLILPVGAWVIRTALAQLAAWDRAGLPPVGMAVNLSARQLRQPYLLALIDDTLRETHIHPGRLELELTESLVMEDTEANRGVLAGLARIGVRLAIDDFGTGHSSLSYLRRLDVDTLKIDRSFVSALPHDAEDCAIATAVLALGHSLQLKVVAEGVENAAQAAFLRELGCDEMQGYLLSRPLPAPEFAQWLGEYERRRKKNVDPRRFAVSDSRPLPLMAIESGDTLADVLR